MMSLSWNCELQGINASRTIQPTPVPTAHPPARNDQSQRHRRRQCVSPATT